MKPTLYLCIALLALTVCAVHADPAKDFLQVRRSLGPRLLTAAQTADALQNPGGYPSRTLDAAATVSGVISAGDTRTVLLTIHGNSISMPIQSTLPGAAWLDSGARVRILLAVAPEGDALSGGLRLLIVAPEGDVAAAEALAARRLAQSRPRSLPSRSLLSRSLPARRDRQRRTVYLADVNPGRPAGALSARALSIYAPYRQLVRRWNRRLAESDVDKITTSILYFSDVNNIDPRLPVAMIIAESDFDLYSTSRTGAMGLGQLMPSTARGLGVTNAYDPIQNIGAAVHILRGHLDSYGGAPSNAGVIPFSQIALTMAAYNAGPGAVRKYHGVPPYRETQRYIKRVTALYRQMCGSSEQVSQK